MKIHEYRNNSFGGKFFVIRANDKFLWIKVGKYGVSHYFSFQIAKKAFVWGF